MESRELRGQAVKARKQWRRVRDEAWSRASLRYRVATLEAERAELAASIQELRGLGGRVSELADVVTELLAVEAMHADPEFQQVVDRYRGGI